MPLITHFYCVPPTNISDKCTLTREFCRFLQARPISMTFEKKLVTSNLNHERMYKLIMDLIFNVWNEVATLNWNFSKTPFKKFCYNNIGTSKVKDFQKRFNKEILLQICQINISWPNFMDEKYHIWRKFLLIVICFDGCIFSIRYNVSIFLA